MGIKYNMAGSGLAVNPLEPDDFKDIRPDQVPQYLSGTNAWQLVLIPHQDQPGSGYYRLKQRMHKRDIHHGHLINDNHIRF